MLLGLCCLAALALPGCGKSSDVTVDVRDAENHPVPGIEIRQVGKDTRLGVTGADGRATIRPAMEGEGVQVRLAVVESQPAGQLVFDNPYTIDRDALKRGYRLFRVEANAGGPADSSITLLVESVPAGAQLLLDGTLRGITPASLDSLAAGPVTLELRLDGWNAHRVDLYLTPGANEYRQDLTRAEVTTASLQVLSDPPGARISLNGKSTGKSTPADFSGLAAGSYAVRVTRSGYQPWETRLRLEPGRAGVADAGMLAAIPVESSGSGSRASTPPAKPPERPAVETPRTSPDTRHTYSVSTSPGFAEVYVDDDGINRNLTGNFKITLGAGTHRFRLKNETAGVDLVLQYQVKPGDSNNVLILNYESRKIAARNDPRAGR
jgi:hypothetical protein